MTIKQKQKTDYSSIISALMEENTRLRLALEKAAKVPRAINELNSDGDIVQLFNERQDIYSSACEALGLAQDISLGEYFSAGSEASEGEGK